MSLGLTNKRFIIIGLAGSLSLLVLYFIVLSAANSFTHAVSQFAQMWYWILLLIVGFGLQVGLYSYIRASFRLKQMAGSTAAVATSGGISTGSMVACCLHHLTDVLPLMGLATAAVFLAEYQLLFIVLGILSNLIGITIMLEIIKKHSLYEMYKKANLLRRIARLNIKTIKNWEIAGSILILFISFLSIRAANVQEITSVTGSSSENSAALMGAEQNDFQSGSSENLIETEKLFLTSKINDEGGLSIEIRPLDFAFNKELRLEVLLDTHQGNLDFDLTKKTVLIDDQGNQYLPLEWQGEIGGHHLSGMLIFPSISPETTKIELKIFNVYGVKERKFSWVFGGATSENSEQ